MTITPSGWLSNSMQAVDDILVASSNMQTLMGVGSSAAAALLGQWFDVRASIAAPFYWLKLSPGTWDSQGGTARVPHHVDEIEAYILWTEIATGATGDKQRTLLQANLFGGLLADVYGNLNRAGYLIEAELAYEPPQRTADDSPYPGCWDATITFRWNL